MAVYGVSDWSRNLEAAGQADVTMRGRTERVEARRLSPTEAAPILRDAMADAPGMIRWMTAPYFEADLGASISDWEAEAAAHPVFMLTEGRTALE